MREARIPAVKAPIKAAAAGGAFTRSTSSNRSVFAIAPILAAATASGIGLLNMMENPNTPQKLAISLNIRCNIFPICNVVNSSGCKCSNKAIIHANTVATSTIIIE